MKTPMQELLENMDVFIGQGMSYSEWKKLTYSGKSSIERFLDIEKEVIINANIAGMEFIPVDPNRHQEDAEKYYNETFKTKER
jgi:hypothetical protein